MSSVQERNKQTVLAFYEAAINRVTNDAFDPVAKIPELKYCAVRVTAGGTPPEQVSFGGGQALAAVLETARG